MLRHCWDVLKVSTVFLSGLWTLHLHLLTSYWLENEKQEVWNYYAFQHCLWIILTCFRATMCGPNTIDFWLPLNRLLLPPPNSISPRNLSVRAQRMDDVKMTEIWSHFNRVWWESEVILGKPSSHHKGYCGWWDGDCMSFTFMSRQI